MARQIIVLGTSPTAAGGFYVRFAMWLATPANSVVINPNATSAVPPSTAIDPVNGVSLGYTPAELAALQAGTVVERLASSQGFPAGTLLSTVRTALQNIYAAAQATLNAGDPGTKFTLASWDGNVWVLPP
jgi:hypothetical protein